MYGGSIARGGDRQDTEQEGVARTPQKVLQSVETDPQLEAGEGAECNENLEMGTPVAWTQRKVGTLRRRKGPLKRRAAKISLDRQTTLNLDRWTALNLGRQRAMNLLDRQIVLNLNRQTALKLDRQTSLNLDRQTALGHPGRPCRGIVTASHLKGKLSHG